MWGPAGRGVDGSGHRAGGRVVARRLGDRLRREDGAVDRIEPRDEVGPGLIVARWEQAEEGAVEEVPGDVLDPGRDEPQLVVDAPELLPVPEGHSHRLGV